MNYSTHQGFKRFNIFDFVPAKIQVRQLWAAFEELQVTGNSVVTQFELRTNQMLERP